MKFPPWLKVYGNKKYRGNCPIEAIELITFFNVIKIKHPEIAKVAIHPRNEGNRTHAQTIRHKSEGMNPGASDIIIPGTPTFVCELKRRDHTKSGWEPGQIEYLEAANNRGCFVCVALGYEAILEALEECTQS